LVTDAVAADVEEAVDAEVGRERAGMRTTRRVPDRRRRHRVVHHDGQLVGIVDAQRRNPHRGELQIDEDRHVHVDDDGVPD
jgi:hypothetical protein